MSKKELWELKYRPKSIDDYVFQNEKHRSIVEKFISEASIPHLLLNGHRGTGKTSLAVVLKNELGIDDSDFIVINASDENNVDTIRNKIKNFISTIAYSDFKLVFLDEADYLTHSAQAILRNMMEEYADNARFILSCNKGNKIIPEIKSRCFELLFKKIDKDDILEKLASILKKEKIRVPSVELLETYVDLAYPDMRKAIQLIQSNVKDGQLQEPTNISHTTELNLQIVDLIQKNKFMEIRDLLSSGLSDDDWIEIYKFLYTYLNEVGKFEQEGKWKAGIVIIADHLYRHSIVADPEINAMAMFIRLSDV